MPFTHSNFQARMSLRKKWLLFLKKKWHEIDNLKWPYSYFLQVILEQKYFARLGCTVGKKICGTFVLRKSMWYFKNFACTSVCLIYFPKRAADSKKCWRDMKILNIVSKILAIKPIILKIFRTEILVVVEIYIGFDLLTIVKFQIYSFILPILQANPGKFWQKCFQIV